MSPVNAMLFPGRHAAFQRLGPAEHDVERGDGLVGSTLRPIHDELAPAVTS